MRHAIVYEIVPATSQHASELSLTMRKADRDEVVAQADVHPAFGLGYSIGNSEKSWAGLADGEVLCLFGVAAKDEMDATVGAPWMLGSDALVTHQRAFLRGCHGVVAEMQSMFPVLENHVDARNTTAIRWLRWLGFDIFATEPYGPFNLPFHPFRRVRS